MGKNIKINEEQLHQIIKESVERVLNEGLEEGLFGNIFGKKSNQQNQQPSQWLQQQNDRRQRQMFDTELKQVADLASRAGSNPNKEGYYAKEAQNLMSKYSGQERQHMEQEYKRIFKASRDNQQFYTNYKPSRSADDFNDYGREAYRS